MCLKKPPNVAPRISSYTVYIYLYKTRLIVRIDTNNNENIVFALLRLDLFITAKVGGSNKNAKPEIISSGSSQLLTRVPVLDQLNRIHINCQFLANHDFPTARLDRLTLLNSFILFSAPIKLSRLDQPPSLSSHGLAQHSIRTQLSRTLRKSTGPQTIPNMCHTHVTYFSCGHVEDQNHTMCPQAMTQMNHNTTTSQTTRNYQCAACFARGVEQKAKATKGGLGKK